MLSVSSLRSRKDLEKVGHEIDFVSQFQYQASDVLSKKAMNVFEIKAGNIQRRYFVTLITLLSQVLNRRKRVFVVKSTRSLEFYSTKLSEPKKELVNYNTKYT